MTTSRQNGTQPGAAGPRSWWAGASRYSSAVALLLVVGIEIGILVFVIRDWRTANAEVQRMYAGSVQGLRRIGELQYQAQETRRSTLYALTTNDSNLQVEYADQSRAADRRVSEGVRDYLDLARTPAEREAGRRLAADWNSYLQVRDEVLASILEGSTKEAVQLDLSGGVPSFERVRGDLEEVQRLYDEEASRQLAAVAGTSNRSVARLLSVLAFTLVFVSASIWLIQRSRLMSKLQLAQMQMDFVASVSHELRTPLAVISSAADNIADGVVGGEQQLKRYGGLIRNQSRQVTDLVNQILLFASTHSHEQRYLVRPVEAGEVIHSVLDSNAELLHGAGFTVEPLIEAGLPPLLADRSALVQCLQNLLVNAVKYSGASRWVGIRAFAAQAANSGREVCISVEDRGIGIAGPEIPRIFEPFYRSPAVAAAQIHGTGLGLPVARSIVEAMGGRLSVESKLGSGSTFTLHFPAASEGAASTAATPATTL